MVVFIVAELVIGGLVGGLLLGYQSYSLEFTLQGLLHLVAFFVGGFTVGLISPGARILEPAVAGFLSVALMFVLTAFVPYPWFAFRLSRVLVGGTMAFVTALVGSYAGERLTGQV